MVRMTLIGMAALQVLSCGCGYFASGHASGDDSARTKPLESPARDMDEFELTRDEFEGLERLSDNPADSRDAGLDELLSIPGFPERLGHRVVAEKGARGGWSWLKGLTPPELEELYRFRDYLLLPERGRPRLDARVTGDGLSGGEARRADCALAFSWDDRTARWRGRCGEERVSAWYLSCGTLSRAVRIHAGSFVPGFGMGLTSGGSFSSYLFSGTYPFHGSRRILGSVSFYGQSILGGAGELWHRRMRGVLYAGRMREYRSGRFELAEDWAWGGRLELPLGSWEIGISSVSEAAGVSRGVQTFDARWRSDETNLGFELGARASGEPAFLCGFSHRAGGTRAALLISSIPQGVAGAFGGVNGRSLGSSLSLNGATAVVERVFPSRIRVRTAVERFNRNDGFEERSRDALRVEAQRQWRGASLKLAWTSSVAGRGRRIPFPADVTPVRDETAALSLHSTLELSKEITFKVVLRGLRENNESGLFCAPALHARLFSGRLTVALSCAVLRAFEGAPACYFYEPSPKGIYPWLRAPTGAGRLASVITYNINKLNVSLKVALEEDAPPDCILQAAAGFQ